jgi:hypothetical protein
MASLFKLKAESFDIDAQAQRVYDEYPRKIGKGDALTAIRKAVKEVGFDKLHEAVLEYAKACKACQRKKEFIPYPATWIRARRWEDDREDWWRGAVDVEAIAAYDRLKKFARRYGARHPEVSDPDFTRAKNVARDCGGWQLFVDGKVSQEQFVAAWKSRK